MEYGPCHDANDDFGVCWRYRKTTAKHERNNRRKPKAKRTFGASKAGMKTSGDVHHTRQSKRRRLQ